MKESTKRAKAMTDEELARQIPILDRRVRTDHADLHAMRKERQRRAEAAKAEAKRA